MVALGFYWIFLGCGMCLVTVSLSRTVPLSTTSPWLGGASSGSGNGELDDESDTALGAWQLEVVPGCVLSNLSLSCGGIDPSYTIIKYRASYGRTQNSCSTGLADVACETTVNTASGATDSKISDMDLDLMMCTHLSQCEVALRQGVQLQGKNCYKSNIFWVDYLCIAEHSVLTMNTNLDERGLDRFLVSSINYPWTSYPPYSYIMCRVQAPRHTPSIKIKVLDFELGDPRVCSDKFLIKSRDENYTACGDYATLEQTGSLEFEVMGNWMEVVFESFAGGDSLNENNGFLFQISASDRAPLHVECGDPLTWVWGQNHTSPSPTPMESSTTQFSSTHHLTSTTDHFSSTTALTSTTDIITSTTDRLTSTTDRLTSTTDRLTSTTDHLTSTTDILTSTTDRLTSTTDRLTSTTDHLTSTTDHPTSTTDHLTSTKTPLTSGHPTTEYKTTTQSTTMTTTSMTTKTDSGSGTGEVDITTTTTTSTPYSTIDTEGSGSGEDLTTTSASTTTTVTPEAASFFTTEAVIGIAGGGVGLLLIILIIVIICCCMRNRKRKAKPPGEPGRLPPSQRTLNQRPALQRGDSTYENAFTNPGFEENVYDTIPYDAVTYAKDKKDTNTYETLKDGAAGQTNSYETPNIQKPMPGQTKYSHLESFQKPQAKSNDYERPQTGLNRYANPELRAPEPYKSLDASMPIRRPLAVVNPHFVQPPSVPKPDNSVFSKKSNPAEPEADYEGLPDYQDLPENPLPPPVNKQAQTGSKPGSPEYLELTDAKPFDYSYAYM